MEDHQQIVYFHARDYAGPVRRMIAFIIDQLGLIVLLFVMTIGAGLPQPPDVIARREATQDRAEKARISQEYYARPEIVKRMAISTWVWFAFAIVYHIALRKTHGGTLGHRLTGIRLIDATNEPPPWRVLLKRFFLGVLLAGPFGASYFLCLKDPKRQALHDRWCNTWMVRSRATPAGPGVLIHRLQLLATWAIHYLDVEPVADAPNPEQSPVA